MSCYGRVIVLPNGEVVEAAAATAAAMTLTVPKGESRSEMAKPKSGDKAKPDVEAKAEPKSKAEAGWSDDCDDPARFPTYIP